MVQVHSTTSDKVHSVDLSGIQTRQCLVGSKVMEAPWRHCSAESRLRDTQIRRGASPTKQKSPAQQNLKYDSRCLSHTSYVGLGRGGCRTLV